MEHTDLEQSVLRTVLWFSIFSFPVTAFEIWKWLLKPEGSYNLAQVYAVLEKSDWLQEKLETREGFYTLKARGIEAFIKERQRRFLDAEHKFALLRRSAKYFYLLPGVRAVAAVNTMAWWSTTPTSDIDLYILTSSGLIWSSRFWLVLPFLLLGRRPTHGDYGDGVRDPFCFSFFASVGHLGIEDLCVSRDVYLAFWVKSIVPIIDRDDCFVFFQRENCWASSMLPNAELRPLHPFHRPQRLPSLPIQWRLLEPVWRFLQRRRLPVSLRRIANIDSRVVITDSMLKFHDNDRREQFRDEFESLVKLYI